MGRTPVALLGLALRVALLRLALCVALLRLKLRIALLRLALRVVLLRLALPVALEGWGMDGRWTCVCAFGAGDVSPTARWRRPDEWEGRVSDRDGG